MGLSIIGSLRIYPIGPRLLKLEPALLAKKKTLFGVPQGSVLGPLLFLIYINDIYRASHKLNFFLFADDTNILYTDKNLKSFKSVVNEELGKVLVWLNVNKLSLNTGKSNFVIFHPYQRKADYNVLLKIYDNDSKKATPLKRKQL